MNNNQNNGELNLNVVLVSIIRFVRESLKIYWVFLLFFLLFSGFLLFQAFNANETFLASRTFVLNEESSLAGLGGGLSSALDNIPFGLGARTNNNKIIQISKSNRVVFEVVLDSVAINGFDDLVGNHLIDIYKIREEWEERPGLASFKFEHDDILMLSSVEVEALKELYVFLIEGKDDEPLIQLKVNDETNIFTLETNTVVDELSIELSKSYFKQLSEYYEGNKTKRHLNSLNSFSAKTDSIHRELMRYEGLLASVMDRSGSILLNKNKTKAARYQRQVSALSIMYGESLKNTEVARFLYQRSIPYFEVIDAPKLPLSMIGASKLKAILIGGILAAFFGGVIVLVRIFINDIFLPSWKDINE